MTAITLNCNYCGRPIIGGYWLTGGGGEFYHHECTMPPRQTYQPMPLTEADIRRIIGEELCKWDKYREVKNG